MRALTLYQPWASLVAVGAKTIETRSRPTSYRGPLLIHAGKRVVDRPGIALWQSAAEGRDNLPAPVTPLGNLPLGAVVASCQLIDCVPIVGILDDTADGPHIAVGSNGLALLRPVDGTTYEIDGVRCYQWTIDGIEAQRPFGDFSPGWYAWLLGDVKPTTERCPRCWGDHRYTVDAVLHGVEAKRCVICDRWRQEHDCPTCAGAGACDPVPMRGRQGLWAPKPEDWLPDLGLPSDGPNCPCAIETSS